MRRFLPFLFLVACGAKHPPENAYRIAGPGEPCFEHPKPWEDPVGPPIQNTQNLPRCGPRFDTLGDRPVYFRLSADAGAD